MAQAFPGTDSAHRGLIHALALLTPVWNDWGGVLNVIATNVLWLVPLIGVLVGAVHRRVAADARAGSGKSDAPIVRPLAWALAFGVVAVLGAIALAKSSMHVGFPAADRFSALFIAMTLSWICVAIVLASVVSAAIAALLVPEHRLPATLVAATATTTVGLVATFVTESTDGCVRPLADVMHVCVWQPSLGWNLTMELANAAFTFSVLAACATAGIISAVARPIGRSGGLVPVRRSHKSQSENPSRRCYRTSVLVASVVAAVGLTAATVPAAYAISENSGAASSESVNVLLAEAYIPVNVPNGIRSIQVAAWFSFGGDQVAQQFITSLDQLSAHLSQATAASPSGNLSAQWVSMFESDCRSLAGIVQQADSYFQIPHPDIQPSWAEGLAEAAQAAKACTHALEQSNGPAFISAMNLLIDGGNRLDAAYKSLETEVARYGLNG